MDAVEDREVKLQRASSDLVSEFSVKLPSLLWKSRPEQGNTRVPRRWTPAAKTERLVALLEPFQEWPQLLDPHLQTLLPPLVDAFLAYLLKHRDQYASKAEGSQRQQAAYPLPRAVCRILYTFCKVRGVKVISRFLNNEPKYLDPLLRAFIEWDSVTEDEPELSLKDIPLRLIWEERYMMLIWLSHLLFAPFDLDSMSSDDIPIPYENLRQLKPMPAQTPNVTKSLLSVALNYVNVSGKEREAATVLLARLVLRRDMQALGLLTNLTDWAFSMVQPKDATELPSVYTCIGVLSFIARLGASGQVEDFAPLVAPLFEQTLRVVQGDSGVSDVIKSSALARKTIIKILRSVTVMALSLSERGNDVIPDDQVSTILEDAIDHFLVALADNDTPVRFAASKALSIITLKLDPDMAAEVIEAVTGSLDENILFEKLDGTIVTPLEARRIGINTLKRNLSAVDAQRWQGLILTLGHLLFRRAPPTHQLTDVLQPLVSGLDFEQRSSTGSSVGTGVRDASCFGIWALSRKYTTQELLALKPQTISTATAQGIEETTLQMLAIELVCAACVDPSGNIRRGASAALQELIGRHPNTIAEGISLVQVVDYHAVARRSRAMNDVAKATACVSHHYWAPLVESLMHWRGIGSPDAESRRHAAKAIGNLSTQKSYKTMQHVFQRLLNKISSIPHSDVETRHGCLLALSATIDAFDSLRATHGESGNTSEALDVANQVATVWEIFGSLIGPTKDDLTLQTFRPELTAEASSCLILSLSRSVTLENEPRSSQPPTTLLDKARKTLLLCISRSEDISIESSSNAVAELLPLLTPLDQETVIQGWFSHIHTTWNLPTGRGQITALGAVFRCIDPDSVLRKSIIDNIIQCAEKEELIEKRVAAVKSLATGVLPHIDVTDDIVDHLVRFLNDYTTDRRGDIGSLIRLEAIQAAKTVLEKETGQTDHPQVRNIVGCLCRLSAEKLDKVRVQAWICLQSYWGAAKGFPPLTSQFDHFTHISSVDYFLQLLQLQDIDWLRLHLFQGLATSAVAGSEGLIRSSRWALVQRIQKAEAQQTLAIAIIEDLAKILGENLQDDRFAIPVMELLAFLLDGFVYDVSEDVVPSLRKLFVIIQKAHFKSANILRLEAAVRAYAPLSRIQQLHTDVFKKMTAMLLHPFPRVRNLEERIKVEQLKEALEEIFSEYGTVVEIVAKTNLKAKGQAFIVFDSVDSATRAIDEINGFELFDKPMVIDYAKTRSDATVLREGGEDELEAHKRRRLAEKGMFSLFFSLSEGSLDVCGKLVLLTTHLPTERKQAHEALEAQKKLKRPSGPAEPGRPAKTAKGAGLKPTSGAAAAVIPDEYLPPNKILFLRDLPDTVDQGSLTAVFGRFEGFQEVRLVPGRKGIAFVEYEDESGAISAKEATSGMPMGESGTPIRVTYQRQ
ncbi:hypothetical protein BO71DRAFT_321191 [Aspergillus ellipticus CBS 707.79]|uniref:RRM domain-containing protein n=1 Tax=Aspergillus ellipticus CBS 707.79 TaxID=1448320 RepID=A0A319E6G7_9EURO|nr:hypothetical protein BO71DRAFT_321191 [Aspergillus ellipticus CBS 707.79]